MDSLDTIYSFDVYSYAENICDNKGVNVLSESDQFLNLQIADEIIYEVELVRPFTKKFKSSCTCEFHSKNKFCVHTVAGLIHLKRRAEDHNTSEVISSPKPKKLRLSDVLDNVPHSALLKFIKSYSSKDKKLNIALKVHFAKYVDLQDNSEKYKTILESVIKPITTANQKLSQSEWSSIKSICKDLLDQTEDLIVLNGAFEALEIIQTVISKLSYIQTAYQKNTADLTELLNLFHQSLANLYTSDISGKLKQQYKEAVTSLLNTSYYQITTPIYHAAEILFKNKLIDLSVLSEILKIKIKQRKNENELYLVYSLLIRISGDKFDYTTIPSAHFVLLERIADDLLLHKEKNVALKLLYHFHNSKVRNPLTLKLARILLDYNSTEKLNELANLFIETKDLRIIDYIQHIHKDISSTFIKEVFSSSKFELLTKSITFPYFLHKIGKTDDLLEYLTAAKNFELLKNFDTDINRVRPLPLALLYTNMVDEYLKNHIGENSVLFINQLVQHLEKIKAKDAVKHIKYLIKESYGHRSGFQE